MDELFGTISNSSHPSCVPNQGLVFHRSGSEWVAEFACGGGVKELVMREVVSGPNCSVGFFVRGAHQHNSSSTALTLASTFECDPFEATATDNNWLMLSYCGCGGVDTGVRFDIEVTE